MGKVKKNIKTFFKVIHFLIILILLGVIGFIIYCLHPIYMELEPTTPANLNSSDKISWTFFRYPENQAVYQRITVSQDGRNIVEITRENGDFDNEMLGPITPWKPKLNKETGIITFKKQDVIGKDKAKALFREAIDSGVIDITTISSSPGARCRIDFEIGEHANSESGPDNITASPNYPPEKWINQIYWEKLISLIDQDPQLNKIMRKNEFIKNKP